MAEEVELKRGLRDVYLDNTTASNVIGDVGKLIYRGYDIHDLAENSTFEETVFLLIHDRLPTQEELDSFDSQLRNNRELPVPVLDVINNIKSAHPMDVLRTAVSALSGFTEDAEDSSYEAGALGSPPAIISSI